MTLLGLGPGLAAHAASSPWTAFGPGGGSVLSLAVDPGNPGLVYAVAGFLYAGPFGTLYRSPDGGAAWTALVGPDLQAVAIDPAHPSTIYAGGSRVLRSADGGHAWIDVTPPPATERHSVSSLAVAPSGVVFAADGETLLRSADGGGTWSAVLSEQVAFAPLTVLVNPSDPGHVYSASRESIYVSSDGGASFTPAARPAAAAGQPLGGFALAPSAPGTLYAMLISNPAVFRSDDRAATWRTAGSLPVGSTGFQVLQVDPRAPGTVYAGTGSGLFKSTNGGRSWTQSDAGLPRPSERPLAIVSLAAAPSQPDSLYAGTVDWGVGRSRSAGEHWQMGLENGLNAAAVQLLKFPRPDTAYLALGYGGPRSFRSADGGQTWQPFAREITLDGLTDLAWEPDHPEDLYAFNSKGLWRSLDEGSTWKQVSASVGHRLAVLDRSTLLSDVGCGLYRSGNGGRTWRRVLSCQVNDEDLAVIQDLRVDPRDTRNVYAYATVSNGSSHFGFAAYRSRDGGAHWKALQIVLSSFAVAPSDFRILYAIDPVYARLLRSADGGEHWNVVSPSLPAGVDTLFGPMVVDGGDPDTVYLGAASGVQVSHDGGANFALVDAPFEAGKRQVGRLWTDLSRPGLVYAMPAAGGLFVGRFE
jgi:photosystem II stability/assembly factor-like uncharacterized protein